MRTLLVCAVALSWGLTASAIAQEFRAGNGSANRFQRGEVPRDEPKQAGRLVSVEVVIADVTADGDAGGMTAERLAELDKAGKVKSLSRYRLATVENQPAVLQFGERVAVVTGRVFAGGRAEGARGFSQESVAQENVGAIFNVTTRVESDESILVELKAEQTRLAPPAPKPVDDNAAEAGPPRTATETMTSQTTVRVSPGKSVVAGSKTTRTPQGTIQSWILVSATAEAARPQAAEEASALKVFALAHAKADSLAEVLQTVFRDRNIRVSADLRTNSLVVHGNEESLDVIQRLIMRLDDAQGAADK